MNCSIIFILIIIMVKHESLGQDDEENKPECPNRKAVPFSSDLIGSLPQNWYVNRLTIMTKLPPSAHDPPQMNCCSPLTYLADCRGKNPAGGIHVSREWQPDGGFIKITKAYSDKFQNVAEFWEVNMIYDSAKPPKLIYGGFLRFMYLHYSATKTQEIKSYDFPPLILFAAAREYAIVYYQPELKWVHYMDCDYAVSWIEMSEDAINKYGVDSINKEIDTYLTSTPNIPAMELIPPVLPF